MYLYERAKLLNIQNKFSRLSRIINENCDYVETKLASSALGENILKYYKMSGRIVFDLMKVIQRDHRLASYKLGKKDGIWYVWDDNGKKRFEMNYKDGEKTGVWSQWDEKGDLLATKDYGQVN